MIQNNWRKCIAKRYPTQNAFADALGWNKGAFSMVCKGERVMPIDELQRATGLLGCSEADIYSPAVLAALYALNADGPEKKKPQTVCVRIRAELADELDALVADGVYFSRNEAVNALVKAGIR